MRSSFLKWLGYWILATGGLFVIANCASYFLRPDGFRMRNTADGIVRVGCPFVMLERGGFAYHEKVSMKAFCKNVMVAAGVAALGLSMFWEVGSGQNWVGYYVAGMLGLHEHLLALKDNVVPRFLLLDQPSQVYFPEAWPTLNEPSEGKVKRDVSADIEGVQRIFRALSHFMDLVKAQFQIIVTEHAGSITWEGVPHVHLVGNWRKGHDEFLIPDEWLRITPPDSKL
jgi:Protein of unknown function (DUF3732)